MYFEIGYEYRITLQINPIFEKYPKPEDHTKIIKITKDENYEWYGKRYNEFLLERKWQYGTLYQATVQRSRPREWEDCAYADFEMPNPNKIMTMTYYGGDVDGKK